MNTPTGPTSAEPPLIRLRGVTKVYGEGAAEVAALRGVDLDIATGEFVAIMGPSGSGKSTAMNILGCLDTPTAGARQVWVLRDDVPVAVPVTAGISDGRMTEITGGALQAGMQVITDQKLGAP